MTHPNVLHILCFRSLRQNFFLDKPQYFHRDSPRGFSGFFIKNRGAQALRTLDPSYKVCRSSVDFIYRIQL